MTKHEGDLIVAGAGPAGLAAAIYAARAGMRVDVFEPRSMPIDKACGEGIMPAGVDALDELGIRPKGVPFVGIRYVDALDPKLDAYGRFPSGLGLGVRRIVLQGAMMDRAKELGVRFHAEPVSAFEDGEDGVLVNGRIHAGWLIGADGLRSSIRRALGVEQRERAVTRFGLRRHHTVRPWSDCVEVHFGDGAEAYVTPVDSNVVGVAFLFERGGPSCGEAFDALVARFPFLAARLANAPAASRVRGAGPFEQRVRRRVVGHVMLVGDAAGYVDPLTGDGIAIGIATAQAAITSVLARTPSAYEARYRQLTRRYVLVTSMMRAVARRRRLARALLRLARSLPRVFDDILGTVGQ